MTEPTKPKDQTSGYLEVIKQMGMETTIPREFESSEEPTPERSFDSSRIPLNDPRDRDYRQAAIKPKDEPPWNEIDAGIRPLVRALWDAGLKPFSSCEGHYGLPFVCVRPDGMSATETEEKLVEVVIANGYRAFDTEINRWYRDARPNPTHNTPWVAVRITPEEKQNGGGPGLW